jgi:hypothetical protein
LEQELAKEFSNIDLSDMPAGQAFARQERQVLYPLCRAGED